MYLLVSPYNFFIITIVVILLSETLTTKPSYHSSIPGWFSHFSLCCTLISVIVLVPQIVSCSWALPLDQRWFFFFLWLLMVHFSFSLSRNSAFSFFFLLLNTEFVKAFHLIQLWNCLLSFSFLFGFLYFFLSFFNFLVSYLDSLFF